MGLGGVPFGSQATGMTNSFQIPTTSKPLGEGDGSSNHNVSQLESAMSTAGLAAGSKGMTRSSSAPVVDVDQIDDISNTFPVVPPGMGEDEVGQEAANSNYYEYYYPQTNSEARLPEPLLNYSSYLISSKKASGIQDGAPAATPFTNDPSVTVGPSIRHPMPRRAGRHMTPGAIGERVPTRNASYSEVAEGAHTGMNLIPKSVADRIQEDFPRTPSPAIAGGRRPAVDTARSSTTRGAEAEIEALNAGSYELSEKELADMRIPSSSPVHRGGGTRSRAVPVNGSSNRNNLASVGLSTGFAGALDGAGYSTEYEFYEPGDPRNGGASESVGLTGTSTLQNSSSYPFPSANVSVHRGPFPLPVSYSPNSYAPDSYGASAVPQASSENLNAQMAAILNAQHQIYAQQLAQMVAINTVAMNAASPPPGGPSFGGPQGLGAGLGRGRGTVTLNSWEIPVDQIPTLSRVDVRSLNREGYGRRVDYGGRGGMRHVPSGDALAGKRSGRGRRNPRGHPLDDIGRVDGRYGAGLSGIPNGDSPMPRSPLLEEFRATSLSVGRSMSIPGEPGQNIIAPMHGMREWKLLELKDHVVEFATDQHGSRFIQQKLESAPEEEVEAILQESLRDAHRLMTDVFGNYVVQKLLDYGGDSAIRSILQELKEKMLVLSLHMYGCRVVQKALEVLDEDARAQLVNELDGHVLKCIRDQNGNHVIQKCIELVPAENIQFIVNAVIGQAVVLAEHSYGCRVVQRILEHGSDDQKSPIMKEIMESVQELIKDQYGNYVIQHVVEHGTPEERTYIIDIVQQQVCALSQHKFASNVVERCLTHGTPEQRRTLIEILIVGEHPLESSPLNHLVRDQFGNYVVQRVLDEAEPSQRERVVNILRNQVSTIKKYSYGKHIIARLEAGWSKSVGQGFGTMQSNSDPF